MDDHLRNELWIRGFCAGPAFPQSGGNSIVFRGRRLQKSNHVIKVVDLNAKGQSKKRFNEECKLTKLMSGLSIAPELKDCFIDRDGQKGVLISERLDMNLKKCFMTFGERPRDMKVLTKGIDVLLNRMAEARLSCFDLKEQNIVINVHKNNISSIRLIDFDSSFCSNNGGLEAYERCGDFLKRYHNRDTLSQNLKQRQIRMLHTMLMVIWLMNTQIMGNQIFRQHMVAYFKKNFLKDKQGQSDVTTIVMYILPYLPNFTPFNGMYGGGRSVLEEFQRYVMSSDEWFKDFHARNKRYENRKKDEEQKDESDDDSSNSATDSDDETLI